MAPLRYEHGEYRGLRRSQVEEGNFREDEEKGAAPPNPRRVREKLITKQQRQEPQIVADSSGIVFPKPFVGTVTENNQTFQPETVRGRIEQAQVLRVLTKVVHQGPPRTGRGGQDGETIEADFVPNRLRIVRSGLNGVTPK